MLSPSLISQFGRATWNMILSIKCPQKQKASPAPNGEHNVLLGMLKQHLSYSLARDGLCGTIPRVRFIFVPEQKDK